MTTTTTMTARAYAEIREDRPGVISVESDYRLVESMKAVLSGHWQTDGSRLWVFPLRWQTCLALRAELGEQLSIGPHLTKWAYAEKARIERMTELRTSLEDSSSDFWASQVGLLNDPDHEHQWIHLLSAQKVGAQMIYGSNGRFMLYDETGAGKTRTAIAGMLSLDDPFPALIVCPKSVVINWRRELEKWLPSADIRVVQGTPTNRRKALDPGADVYVIGYGGLAGHSRLAPFGSTKLTDKQKEPKELQQIDFRTVIADEVHRAKTPKSQTTRALWAAAGSAPYRIGLTGTPIQDTPEDLWSVLYFIDPEAFTRKTQYLDRFLLVGENVWGGRTIDGLNPIHKDEFLTIIDAYSRRLTTKMVAPFLPEHSFEERWVEMPAQARKVYKDMKRKLIANMAESGGEGTLTSATRMEAANRLIQLANGTGTVEEDTDPETGEVSVRLQMTSSFKVEAFLEDYESGDYDSAAGLIVFSDSRQVANLLDAALTADDIPHGYINGDVTGDDRQKVIDEFQSGEYKMIVITRAGSEGITLTAADTMVRLVRPWSSVVHWQVQARNLRIGSEIHEHIRYIDYLVEDSVEQKQLRMLFDKSRRAQEVLRDEEFAELLAD
jgi:SNF2 family DNA or RNA helicase